ncbi:hypothetical protein CS063_10295 [Sporanaerobium hydrogeniformans]|uniref:Uncharacterized protein n=1 Tax=Sporanaerobium hydrogeniformans TaxID=3072179 RepID=A0AC61DB62_9FIRM|nr:hypothetical protein [Sporanaerobium hydrogeniformans]PHV70470.1 hypothetical protein CS063_10295 [Sporanaerobium hydrogeniformans]
MKRKMKGAIGIGTSSMIMIFVLLAIVTLGILALETAQADYRLAQRVGESIKLFYEADSQAEEQLACRIEEIADDTFIEGEKNTSFEVTYEVPMGEKQKLCVQVEVTKKSGIMEYKKTDWHVENIEEWQLEENGLGFGDIRVQD